MLKLKNDESTPKEDILNQLQELRPLPINGRAEFNEWSDRIISGVLFENKDDPDMIFSMKDVLAKMLMHVGQTEDHKSDAYFIKALHVNAIKIIASDVIMENDKVRAQRMKEHKEKLEAELVKQAVEAGK